MRYRLLGRTGLKVSVLGVGGGAFAGKEKTAEQVKEVMEFAVQRGINLVETAEDYGEEKIAEVVGEVRDRVILASKSFSSNEKDMRRSIKSSLKKLHTDKIDIYMMHTVDTLESLNFRIREGVLRALKNARSEGIIDWIGITGHRPQTLIEAIKTDEFDVVEVPYCIGASETEKLFEYAKEYGVGVIAMRPFGGGILVDRSRSKASKVMNAANALAYVLSNQNISTALVGMSSIEHAKENLEALTLLKVLKKKRKEIEEKVKSLLGENFCRGCLACMPCEEHGWKFPIDQFMRMEVFYFVYGIAGVREEYKNLKLKADACIKCKKCEELCPYHVPIIEKLEKLAKAW